MRPGEIAISAQGRCFMGDQPTNNVNNDTDAPAGAFKSQSPTHGVTAVASSAPNEARAPLTPTGESLEKTPGQLLKEIRKDLDELWEAQRGSIIAAIKIEKLDQAYEHTRKQRQEILGRIRSNAEKFWLQTGQVKEWIRELTREEDGRLLDHKHKFSVVEDGHEPKK